MSDTEQEQADREAVRTEDTQALEKILYRSLPEWNRCCKDDEFCPYDGHCSTGQARAVIDAGWRPAAAFDMFTRVIGQSLGEALAKVARVEALAERAKATAVGPNPFVLAADIDAALAEPERDEASGR